jgi:hypothetical protein
MDDLTVEPAGCKQLDLVEREYWSNQYNMCKILSQQVVQLYRYQNWGV